ncbi:MAG: DUF1456 family protein [Cyclobacteriaceae bacterium]
MNNNDVIRRVRYSFNLNDKKMIKVFEVAGAQVTREQISAWLKRDDDPDAQPIYDNDLAVFLEGFIIKNRGKKEGVEPKPEKKLNNNIVFRKLKIALNLKDTDLQEIFRLVDFKVSKHELSAFFRNPTQSQYRPCKDQILRNFLHGMQLKFRKPEEEEKVDD